MDRRDVILKCIQESEKPLSASTLAKQFGVSRQIIVGDVALLRAKGFQIIATPRGYICQNEQKEGVVHTIAVTHNEAQLQDELYTIVDLGGTIIDVIVEHPLYGQLSGNLHISSRYDVDQFLSKLQMDQARPLSNLTAGLHLHTIRCEKDVVYHRILDILNEKGFLYHKT